jgi:prepilin-type N-terminal cleavage/methylation domain-containing protein
MRTRQKGFTLIEIAIVLVIIGLLLAGVFRGQELINNSRIKSVINDMRAVGAAHYSYLDRYKVAPGDDNKASTRFVGVTDATTQDGTLAGNYNFNAACVATQETGLWWQHTRAAGFMVGLTTAADGCKAAQHAAGGLLGVQTLTVAQLTGPNGGMAGLAVCAGSIPESMAQAIDAQLDDGIGNTGILLQQVQR